MISLFRRYPSKKLLDLLKTLQWIIESKIKEKKTQTNDSEEIIYFANRTSEIIIKIDLIIRSKLKDLNSDETKQYLEIFNVYITNIENGEFNSRIFDLIMEGLEELELLNVSIESLQENIQKILKEIKNNIKSNYQESGLTKKVLSQLSKELINNIPSLVDKDNLKSSLNKLQKINTDIKKNRSEDILEDLSHELDWISHNLGFNPMYEKKTA